MLSKVSNVYAYLCEQNGIFKDVVKDRGVKVDNVQNNEYLQIYFKVIAALQFTTQVQQLNIV